LMVLDLAFSMHWFLYLYYTYIINWPNFIGSYKNCMNSMLWLIWTIFVHIQYLKYSNKLDISFERHMWMWMLIQKNHIFLYHITSQ
jgi:hypothetical protein